jgi:DNA-binding protein H-NS
MFELGRTIENIRINFDKLRKTLSDKVCKILTKLFKKNNLPHKEKATEVKRKKDFTYVEYIQYTFRNLKLLSDKLSKDNTPRKGKRVSKVSYTYQSQVRYSRCRLNELVKVYLLLKLFLALISFPFNKQF